MNQAIQTSVMNAAKVVEDELDRELEKLDKLEIDDLEALRAKRLKDMKEAQTKKQEWIAAGHGQYVEMKECEIFEASKRSPDLVIHFYKTSTERCKIVDHHMKILSAKHLEARFITVNIEKAPFVAEKLNIRVLPTILVFKNNIKVDKIVGFTDLGNCDDFSTEMLEWRIAQSGVIKYDGDLLTPPDEKKKSHKMKVESKRAIRGRDDDSSDDDYFDRG